MHRKLLVLILLSFGGLFACSQMTPEVQYPVKQDSYVNADFNKWQVGQWSRYKTSSISRDGIFHLFDSQANDGEVLLLVAATQKDAFWLEIKDRVNDQNKYIAALIAADTDKGAVNYKILEIKYAEDEKIQHFNAAELATGQAGEQHDQVMLWLNFILYSFRDGVYRNVKLPAGQFLGIKEVPMALSLRLGQMNGYLWYHNAVPIVPVAKFGLRTSTSQWFKTTETTELVDFGSDGQSSYFSYE